MSRERLLFAAMSLIWGLTWIAVKVRVAAVPPLFFAAARLLAAAAVVLAITGPGGSWMVWRRSWPRLATTALLINTAGYGCLFWGMQFVPSGIAAVANLALLPVGLFALGLAMDEETFSQRSLWGIALGSRRSG